MSQSAIVLARAEQRQRLLEEHARLGVIADETCDATEPRRRDARLRQRVELHRFGAHLREGAARIAETTEPLEHVGEVVQCVDPIADLVGA